ncbi:MAG TPA: glutamyl-tRNA amidotransferase [Balneolaceae bacterium]|nr:glutamyl-tRNA amidotransferase [Balneolaceae bacterium]|tara:strand:- start:37898 stop:38356 length:459 start_codon:yes stop_codon:yes gene_type:complete
MSIKDQIMADLKDAMKAKEQDKLQVLRSLKAKLMEKEIEQRQGGKAELSDEDALQVITKAAKQRKESITQFQQGGREDLVANEEKELAIIETYLPEMMGEDEVRAIVKEKISAMGATGPQDMGKVMGPLMGQLKGKADGALVSRLVKEELAG